MNEKAEFVCDILKEYAKERGTIVRSTCDLSPLEDWLLLCLYKITCNTEVSVDRKWKKVKVKILDSVAKYSKKSNQKLV